MIARATPGEVDHSNFASISFRYMFYVITGSIKSPPQSYGLFMDLFQHFMRKATFFVQTDSDSGRRTALYIVDSLPYFSYLSGICRMLWIERIVMIICEILLEVIPVTSHDVARRSLFS